MQRVTNNWLFSIFKSLFLLLCLIMHNDNIHTSGSGQEQEINITIDSVVDIEITDINVDVPIEKPADPQGVRNCLFIINVLESLINADNLDILDQIVYNTRIAENVITQIAQHYKIITTNKKEIQTIIQILDPQLQNIKLDKDEYKQILIILKEIIELNGVYVIQDDTNNNAIKLVHSHQYVWKKFVEMVMIRKYAMYLKKNDKQIKEYDFVHKNMIDRIHKLYRTKENNIFKYKTGINADIIKNMFLSDHSNQEQNKQELANKQIQSLQIHHIWPKCLCGVSIFANYVILGEANHLLIHISEIYTEIENQESINKLKGIENTIEALAKSVSQQTGAMQELVKNQLKALHYHKIAALTSAKQGTKINVKCKIQNSTEYTILHLQKQSRTFIKIDQKQ